MRLGTGQKEVVRRILETVGRRPDRPDGSGCSGNTAAAPLACAFSVVLSYCHGTDCFSRALCQRERGASAENRLRGLFFRTNRAAASAKKGKNRIIDRRIRSLFREKRVEYNRKETLLKVGERLFAQNGYRDVSIKDITNAAGLGMGSFYTYFDSKEEFYSAILDAHRAAGREGGGEARQQLSLPLFSS